MKNNIVKKQDENTFLKANRQFSLKQPQKQQRSISKKVLKLSPNFKTKSKSTKKITINQKKSLNSFKNLDSKKYLGSPKESQMKYGHQNQLILNESPVYHVKNLKINFFKIIKKKQTEKSSTKDRKKKRAQTIQNTQTAKKSDPLNGISKYVFNLENGMNQIQSSIENIKKVEVKFSSSFKGYYMDDLILSLSKGLKKKSNCHFKTQFQQTLQSLTFVKGIDLTGYKPNGEFIEMHEQQQNKKTLIFDLDETLIHCNENQEMPSDAQIEVEFPSGEKINAGINIRPYAKEIIIEMAKHFEIVIFTASHFCYANPVIDYLDPQKLVVKRLFRQNCSQLTQGLYIKDLSVILNRDIKNMILVDNASYSFLLQLNNGIPIIPFYQGDQDQELYKLKDFLLSLKTVNDVRTKIQQHFKWDLFMKHSSQPNKLVNFLVNDEINQFDFSIIMSTQLAQDHIKTIIKVNLTHSILSMRIPEVRFSKLDPVIDIKMHLEKRFGTSASLMSLVLRDPNGNNIAAMDNEYENLGNYGADNDYIIHCIDEDPNSILKQLKDLSQVEKYVMSDEDYDKLPMNVRKFKKMLYKNNPELFSKKKLEVETNPEAFKELADAMSIGNRCELIKEEYRGEVKYVGKVPDLGDGYFIGIQLDEPWGNNDGTVNGVKFFDCFEKYGIFRRPNEIHVGDYPELDIDEI